jgi:hypothetical protein
MSFNSVVLIVAAVIFVLLLSVFTYFIYESQKRKYNIIPATCPDYWTLAQKKDRDGKIVSSSCKPSADGINWGTCTDKKPPTAYIQPSSLTKPCDIFLNKYAWTRTQCGGNILWDGVTNNDDYRTSCKPAPTS